MSSLTGQAAADARHLARLKKGATHNAVKSAKNPTVGELPEQVSSAIPASRKRGSTKAEIRANRERARAVDRLLSSEEIQAEADEAFAPMKGQDLDDRPTHRSALSVRPFTAIRVRSIVAAGAPGLGKRR